MFSLQFLGTAAIFGPKGLLTGPATQRHRLALLSQLAVSFPRPVSRDKLMALLWPESDTGHARRLLNLAVHVIRRAIGEKVITSGSDGLLLDPDQVICDVVEFERSISAGVIERATAIYVGPFLDGFFLNDAPEFDRTVELERVRLARAYCAALESVASQRSETGDHVTAADCWRKLAAQEPGSSRIVLKLMQSLDDSGDRAGALQQARIHAQFLEQEYGATPDAEVTAYVNQLREKPRPAGPSRNGAELATVAVLPFTNLSPDRDLEYLSDGISDELITALGRQPGLRVAARTSSFSFKGRKQPIPQVARALGVRMVVEGSVRSAGERIRISAQLVEAETGFQLWAEVWERPAAEMLSIQDEIAAAIAETLEVRLERKPERALEPMPDPESHNLYLKGRYAWDRRTREGLERAADYFARAVKGAPRYAEAHAGLAETYALLGFYDVLKPEEAFDRARSSALEALQIEPALAGPHTTLGYVSLYHDWNFETAEREFRTAIDLNSRYSVARQWYANMLIAAGRFDEAVREMEEAQRLDPLSLAASAGLAWVYYYAGRYQEGVEQGDRALELDQNFAMAHEWRALSSLALGNNEEAVAGFERALALSPRSAHAKAVLAYACAVSGQRYRAYLLVQELLGGTDNLPVYEIAKVHLALDEMDAAFDWLERARLQRSHSLAFLRVDPQLDEIRDDTRFGRLLAELVPTQQMAEP